MKNVLISMMLLGMLPMAKQEKSGPVKPPPVIPGNIVIITIDGFRWQEFFGGADSVLINNTSATTDPGLMNELFWASSPEERKKKLMPFTWSVVEKKGQLYGNRQYENKVNVANSYSLSYPGYNEIFTGNTDPFVASNKKYYNPNINVLEYLDGKDQFKGKVVAFTSWDVFPYILNTKRNGLKVNSGYDNRHKSEETVAKLVSEVEDVVEEKVQTRNDQLTFISAREYIKQYRPKVIYLGLGETDESAHDGRYDLYLQQANAADKMIAELWYWMQTTPGYKDNTTFIITTDHGRGMKTGKWTSHGSLIRGSSQVWLAVMGPGIQALGEVKENQQIYQKQLAQTIALLVGEKFETDQPVAGAVALSFEKKAPSHIKQDEAGSSFITVAGK